MNGINKVGSNVRKGFTLIELIVVIAIIGLLASIILASLAVARSKSRDATREENIHQIQLALQLYYNANGQYPLSSGAVSPNNSWDNSNDASWATLQTALAPYIGTLPTDPTQTPSGTWPNNSGDFSYAYDSVGYGCSQQWYMIVYRLENASGPDPGVITCNGTSFQYGGTGASTAVKTVGMSP